MAKLKKDDLIVLSFDNPTNKSILIFKTLGFCAYSGYMNKIYINPIVRIIFNSNDFYIPYMREGKEIAKIDHRFLTYLLESSPTVKIIKEKDIEYYKNLALMNKIL